jgi:phospholipase C
VAGLTNKIKHVIVLTLENRSFNHLLGFQQYRGRLPGESALTTSIDGVSPHWELPEDLTNPAAAKRVMTPDASFALDVGPGHDFSSAQLQMKNANTGFVASYRDENPHDPWAVIKGFSPDRLPVFGALAQNYGLCDSWFSSVPGPTWPNRYFLHAATSGGFIVNPSPFHIGFDSIGTTKFTFKNRTIYNSLDAAGRSWCVYHDTDLPQANSLGDVSFTNKTARSLDDLFQDLAKADPADVQSFPEYSFIEPYYDVIPGLDLLRDVLGRHHENDAHPPKDIRYAELLLKEIYDGVRASRIWNQSLLVILFDEHGGFADHRIPPIDSGKYPTGDDDKYARYGGDAETFDFSQLGLRVPAILVSPYIPAGTIDHTTYDHTSLLKTIENLWGLPPLTRRDEAANSFEKVFVDELRTDDTALPYPFGYDSVKQVFADDPLSQENVAHIDNFTESFLGLALAKEQATSTPEEFTATKQRVLGIKNKAQARQFLRDHRARMARKEHRK